PLAPTAPRGDRRRRAGQRALPDGRDGARRGMTATAALVAALALLAVLAAVNYRQRKQNQSLRGHLEAAAAPPRHPARQAACSRLAPAGVVQRLVSDRSVTGEAAVAERKVVTALFADLAGYTAMSERLEPAALAQVLNGYFQRMSDPIHHKRRHV